MGVGAHARLKQPPRRPRPWPQFSVRGSIDGAQTYWLSKMEEEEEEKN